MVREANSALDRAEISREDADIVEQFLAEADQVLGGVLPFGARPVAPTAEVLELAARRQDARQAKDWAAADRLRQQVAALGWLVEDTPQGPNLKPKR
jgi:cysteinyl-tRNA synthetase